MTSTAAKSIHALENSVISGAPGSVAADVAMRRRSQYFRMVLTAEVLLTQGTRVTTPSVSSVDSMALWMMVVDTWRALVGTVYMYVEQVGVGTWAAACH